MQQSILHSKHKQQPWQISFLLTLLVYDRKINTLVYDRKINTFVKIQNAVAYGASVKDSIKLKTHSKNIFSSSLLIVEAKQVKSRIAKNITIFQIKFIRRLIYVNQLYKV